MTTIPVATTMQAPIRRLADGEADQKIQAMAKAHRIAVYSNGPTTEGGARRKASVSHIWPSAPVTPIPTSQPQSEAGTGRQSPIASMPEPILTSSKYQKTMDMLELARPSVRTVNALRE